MSAQTADGLPEKPSLDANPSQEGKATPIPATPSKKVKADPNDCRKVAEPLLESIKQEGLRLLAENAPQEKLDRLREKYRLLEKDIQTEYAIDRILTRLSEKAGLPRGLKLESADNRKPVRKRLKTDTEADCNLVIDGQCRKWKDTEFRANLNPATLMNGHFEKYLNAALLDKQSPLTPKDGQVETSGFPQNIPVYGR